MNINFRVTTAIKYGPRYWSRGWYKIKATSFKTLRGEPIDYFVDGLRKDHNIIIKNQGKLGSFAHDDLQNIHDHLNGLTLQKGFQFLPGRELIVSINKDVTVDTINRSFDYIFSNFNTLFPDGLPKRIKISKEVGFTHLRDYPSLREVILNPQILEISRLSGLSNMGLYGQQFEILQEEMDKLDCVLYDKTIITGVSYTEDSYQVESGYNERIKSDSYTLNDFLPSFNFEEYNAGKYTTLMKYIVEDAKAQNLTVEIHWGYPLDLEKVLSRQGYKVFNFLMKGERFFEVYIVVKEGRYKYAISIADGGRVVHCQKMLRLSGLREDQIVRYSHIKNKYEQIKELMGEFVGIVPDTVIIGNRGSFRRLIKKHRYAVEYLRRLVEAYPKVLPEIRIKNSEIAQKLVEWHEKYRDLFNLKETTSKLASNGEFLQKYFQLEQELEDLKVKYPLSEFEDLKTIISTFSQWKKRLELNNKDDYLKLESRFKEIANRIKDPELRRRYHDLSSRFHSIFKFERPELKRIFGLDPLRLYEHPANLMNLIRFDEIVVSLYNEHQIIPELQQMRVFEMDVEVGKKIITPLFKCQIINYLDKGLHSKKLLLVDVPYGETVQYLAKYLINSGVGTILFSGIVGGIQGVKKGDKVVPTGFYLVNGSEVKRCKNKIQGTPAFKQVKHIIVDAPYDEVVSWFNNQKSRGIEVVDVELSHIAEAVAKSSTEINFGAVNVVSDLVGVKEESIQNELLREKDELIAARDAIMEYFANFLEISKVSVEIHRYAHPILDILNGRIKNFSGEFRVEFTHPNKDRKRRLEIISKKLNQVRNSNELNQYIKKLEQFYNCRIDIIKTNIAE